MNSVDERLAKILNKNFPDMNATSVDDQIYLLKQISLHGNFVEQVPKALQNDVKKALRILEKIEPDHHYEKIRIQRAISQLREVTTAKHLHGMQHTSNYREKVAMANHLYMLWTTLKGSTPPTTWQKDTHAYSKFVTDILSALEFTWTARQVIDALDKFSNS